MKEGKCPFDSTRLVIVLIVPDSSVYYSKTIAAAVEAEVDKKSKYTSPICDVVCEKADAIIQWEEEMEFKFKIDDPRIDTRDAVNQLRTATDNFKPTNKSRGYL